MILRSELKGKYGARRQEIERRLEDFSAVGKGSPDELFAELAFCICAANSSAEAAWKAQQKLVEANLLFSDNSAAISNVLLQSHVRFHRNKAKYIIESRKRLFDSGEMQRKIDNGTGEHELRDYLVKEAMGVGYKEAAHYLRNIGKGGDFAILDRHIFKNMKSLGVLEERPKSLTQKKYLEIEAKLREFSRSEGIPLAHLDLLFWSEETGRILK